MTVGSLVFEGVQAWPLEQLRETVTTNVGEAFYGLQIIDDRDVLLRLYLNDGYEQVVIDVDTSFSDDLTVADVTFRIDEGYQVIVDHVLIVGNERVDAETILQELTLVSGSALGLDDVAEIRRRLNALGMFRRLDIREFSHGQVERRDLIIEVQEAPATTLAYGGGLEVSQRLRRDAGELQHAGHDHHHRQRQRQEHLPAEPHQLIVAVAWHDRLRHREHEEHMSSRLSGQGLICLAAVLLLR